MKKVIAFGTFDILHPGHIHYLKRAKALGDRLIVVVARDRSVRKIKRKMTLISEKERLSLIKELRIVDVATLGMRIRRKEDAFNILKKYKPDVIALGHDQWASTKALRKWLHANRMKARVVRIRPFKRGLFSSSAIKKAFKGSQ